MGVNDRKESKASRSLHNMADLLVRNLITALSIHAPQNPGS